MSGAEARARALGLLIPDFDADGYYGGDFGSMKSHHVVNACCTSPATCRRARTVRSTPAGSAAT